MRIYSMGDGMMDEAHADLAGKPCIVLVADSREELGTALQGIQFRDAVTVVKVALPSSVSEEKPK